MSTTTSGPAPIPLEAANTSGNRAIHGRVHDCLEIAARARVREHERTELLPVHQSIRRQDVAKPGGDRGGRLGSVRRHAVRDDIGVDAWHAKLLEPSQHVALSRGDAAGQRNLQHV
ncbi:MAG: hypothetical protein QM736_19425 [Vicinamibacterales bacterium]